MVFLDFAILISCAIAGIVVFWLIIRIGAKRLQQDDQIDRSDGSVRKPDAENTRAVVSRMTGRKTTKSR
jgi:hypothetical protein